MDEPGLNERLMGIPGYIVLVRKPGDEYLYGTVENSFDLGVEKGRAFFYWTGKERDGLAWAKEDVKHFRERHPDWEFTIYNARDGNSLPVSLNWPLWLEAHQPSDKTFSGVRNKHEARNLRFAPKEELPYYPRYQRCEELKAQTTMLDLSSGQITREWPDVKGG